MLSAPGYFSVIKLLARRRAHAHKAPASPPAPKCAQSAPSNCQVEGVLQRFLLLYTRPSRAAAKMSGMEYVIAGMLGFRWQDSHPLRCQALEACLALCTAFVAQVVPQACSSCMAVAELASQLKVAADARTAFLAHCWLHCDAAAAFDDSCQDLCAPWPARQLVEEAKSVDRAEQAVPCVVLLKPACSKR